MKYKLLFICALSISFGQMVAQNPSMVYDINNKGDGLEAEVYPTELTVFNGKLYFRADDGIHGKELWVYNGSENPVMVKDIWYGKGSSHPEEFTVFNEKLYFTADDGAHGEELWVYDGINEPIMIKDRVSGTDGSFLRILCINDSTLYFYAITENIDGYELYAYDGVHDPILTNGAPGNEPSKITIYHNRFYYAGSDSLGRELWVWDLVDNPKIVKDIFPGYYDSYPSDLTVFKDRLYFSALVLSHGFALCSYDDSNDSLRVIDLYPGSSDNYPSCLTVFNNKLYFSASYRDVYGEELWMYDGSNAPVMIKDICPGAVGSAPSDLTVYNNKLYFGANNVISGKELWMYDGYDDPVMVKDIFPGNESSFPMSIAVFDNKLFFSAIDKIYGRELWSYKAQLTGDINSFGSSFRVFPNPADRYIHVELGQIYNDITVTIQTVTGQALSNKKYGTCDKLNIELTGNNGLYLVAINTKEGNNAILKIIKNAE